MAHDVFVSYPSQDKTTADAVVAALESHGLRCWYAPRDVEPGADWAGAIVHAIKESRLTVLVFSGAANSSEHILREVRQAADAHTPILPFRISAADPSEPLQYYIGGTHWLDALTEPLEDHLGELVDTTDRILEGSPSGRAELRDEDKTPPIQPAAPSSRGRRNLILAAVGGAIVLVAAIVGLSFLGGGADDSPDPDGDDAQTATDADDVALDARPDFSGTVEIDPVEDGTDETDTVEIDADDGWQTLSFITTDPQVWDVSIEDHLTALQRENIDAFAWSTDNVDGDFAVRLDIETTGTESSGCMVLYGAAQPFIPRAASSSASRVTSTP